MIPNFYCISYFQYDFVKLFHKNEHEMHEIFVLDDELMPRIFASHEEAETFVKTYMVQNPLCIKKHVDLKGIKIHCFEAQLIETEEFKL